MFWFINKTQKFVINCCEIFLGNFQPITLMITTENISQCLSWRRNHANLVKFDCNICYQQNYRFFWNYWTQFKYFLFDKARNCYFKFNQLISTSFLIVSLRETLAKSESTSTDVIKQFKLWLVITLENSDESFKCVFIQSKTFKSRNEALIRTAGILIAELYKSCINSWKYRSQFRKVVNQWFMEFGQTIHKTRIWNSWIKLFLQLITDRPFTF